jgi:hypothetical protein
MSSAPYRYTSIATLTYVGVFFFLRNFWPEQLAKAPQMCHAVQAEILQTARSFTSENILQGRTAVYLVNSVKS